MPGSIRSMAVQKKQSVIPPSQGPLSTRTIESQKVGNRSERTRENGFYIKPDSKKTCSVNKSIQICDTVSPRVAAAANGLNVDERLKAARERREERQKLLVSKELSRLEREQRAKRYYEQQLQERKKKLLEQRLKEDRRRAAVEEKRKLRLREEKERYESAVRRTLERSQKAQQQLSQNSRGRKPSKNVSHHSMNSTTSNITHKLQHQAGSVNHRPPASPSSNSQHRSISPAQIKAAKQQDDTKKNSSSASGNKSSLNTSVKTSTGSQIRTTSPSPERTPGRSISRHSTPLQLELPSVPEEEAAGCVASFAAGNTRPVRGSNKGQQEKLRKDDPPETPCSSLSDTQTEGLMTAAEDRRPFKTPLHSASLALEVITRPSDPEEASRLLAEKRREARIQREKEEQKRLQREEAERQKREEQESRRAEERARQEAEAQRLVEEKKRREEEEQRRAEEERAQAMREAALLQKQREEELAKERAKAEQLKKEREIAAQKEEAERQARKKRLEEIMRRTRRTDSPDTKSVQVRILPNEALPKENTVPVHTGTLEDSVKLPVVVKSKQLGLNNDEDVVPVVAFKERRSLRALSGLEDIQTQQRAEVI